MATFRSNISAVTWRVNRLWAQGEPGVKGIEKEGRGEHKEEESTVGAFRPKGKRRVRREGKRKREASCSIFSMRVEIQFGSGEGGRGRGISEFEASLVYRASTRASRTTQRNSQKSKTKQNKTTVWRAV